MLSEGGIFSAFLDGFGMDKRGGSCKTNSGILEKWGKFDQKTIKFIQREFWLIRIVFEFHGKKCVFFEIQNKKFI